MPIPTTGITWPRIGGSSGAASVTVVSEQHVTNTSSTTHTFSSLTSVQSGDLMILFTGGPYYVSSAPSGWSQFAADSGATAIAISVYAKVATSSSESVTMTFTSGNIANISTVIVLRGGTAAWRFSEQSYGGSQSTTALTFPQNAPTVTGGVGTFNPTPTLAVMFIHGAVTGVTYTPSPAATSTVFVLALPGNRTAHMFIEPVSSSYGATPSASDFKGGAVVLVG